MVKFLLTIQNVSVNVKSRVKIWRAGIELLIMVLDLIIFSRAQLLRHVRRRGHSMLDCKFVLYM